MDETPDPDLTDRQREYLEALPQPTLAAWGDAVGVSKTGAESAKSRLNQHPDIEIEYDAEQGWRQTEGFTTDSDDESEEGEEDTVPTVTATVDGNTVAATDDVPDSFISALRGNGLTYGEMEQRYGWSRDQATRLLDRMSEAGWAIEFDTLDAQGTRRWYIPDARDKRYQFGNGNGTYRFGLISDTHLGSKAAHLAHLHDFYDRMVERGVDVVLHAGDISDGWEVHQNQINEVHPEATGWNRLRDYCVEHYPKRDGIETLFISGNHDRKLWRRQGVRFSEMLADRRDDLHWLGDSMARLVFDDRGTDLELIHPSGGQPYTLGYRAQTLYREQPTNIRPSMAAIGHLHGRMQAAAEGVEAFYTGCWKDLTTYGRRKGHAAEIGGWDVEVTISDGNIDRLVTSWEKYPARDGERGSFEELPDVSDMLADGITADASGTAGMFSD